MKTIIVQLSILCAISAQGILTTPHDANPNQAPPCTATRTAGCSPKTDASGNLSVGSTVQVNPQCDGTTDKRSIIQGAITANANIHITAQTSACVISSPLSIPSNRTIMVDHATVIKLAASAMVAGGTCYAENSDPNGGNTNIRIEGGIWDCNNANQTRAANSGQRYTGVGFRFNNVTNLYIGNLTIRNPLTFGAQVGTVTNHTVENITLDYSNMLDNMDGWHVNGPASSVTIRNIVGATNDDVVCLCANDGDGAQISHGNIAGVLVDGIRGAYRGVRLLADADNITNVTIRHITGSYALDGVLFSNINAATGTIAGIVVEDVKPTTSRNTLRVERNVARISLHDIDTTGGSIYIGGGVTVGYATAAELQSPPTIYSDGVIIQNVNPNFSSGAVTYTLSMDYLGRFFWGYQNTSHIFRANSGTVATIDLNGLQLAGAAPPTCDATKAGLINYSGHTADVKDTAAICAADGSNVWAWRTIY